MMNTIWHTLSGQMIGDPYWANTVLFLHGDGTNGSTTFTDSTGKNTISAFENAQISTAQSKFGGSSMYFDGTGDYLTVPNNANLNLSSGDFTIEGWIYPTSTPNDLNTILSKDGIYSASYASYSLVLTSGGVLFGSVGSGNGVSYNLWAGGDGSAISMNNWHHVALVRSENSIRVFVDGVQSGATQTISGTMIDGNKPLYIGQEASAPSRYFNGYIDDLRITKGVARYTSDFTPPTQAFPNF